MAWSVAGGFTVTSDANRVKEDGQTRLRCHSLWLTSNSTAPRVVDRPWSVRGVAATLCHAPAPRLVGGQPPTPAFWSPTRRVTSRTPQAYFSASPSDWSDHPDLLEHLAGIISAGRRLTAAPPRRYWSTIGNLPYQSPDLAQHAADLVRRSPGTPFAVVGLT
jgi:hypothetical protein